MSRRRRKLPGPVLYWVTVRDEETGELLNSWSFPALKDTESKKWEQEEALDPAGHQTVVAVETTLTGTGDLPPKVLKR